MNARKAVLLIVAIAAGCAAGCKTSEPVRVGEPEPTPASGETEVRQLTQDQVRCWYQRIAAARADLWSDAVQRLGATAEEAARAKALITELVAPLCANPPQVDAAARLADELERALAPVHARQAELLGIRGSDAPFAFGERLDMELQRDLGTCGRFADPELLIMETPGLLDALLQSTEIAALVTCSGGGDGTGNTGLRTVTTELRDCLERTMDAMRDDCVSPLADGDDDDNDNASDDPSGRQDGDPGGAPEETGWGPCKQTTEAICNVRRWRDEDGNLVKTEVEVHISNGDGPPVQQLYVLKMGGGGAPRTWAIYQRADPNGSWERMWEAELRGEANVTPGMSSVIRSVSCNIFGGWYCQRSSGGAQRCAPEVRPSMEPARDPRKNHFDAMQQCFCDAASRELLDGAGRLGLPTGVAPGVLGDARCQSEEDRQRLDCLLFPFEDDDKPKQACIDFLRAQNEGLLEEAAAQALCDRVQCAARAPATLVRSASRDDAGGWSCPCGFDLSGVGGGGLGDPGACDAITCADGSRPVVVGTRCICQGAPREPGGRGPRPGVGPGPR